MHMSNVDFNQQAQDDVEKTVFEIMADGVIVYANSDVETLISLTSGSICWWFMGDNGKFTCTDRLYVHNDFKRVTIEDARKLAADWFEEEMGDTFFEDPENDPSFKEVRTPDSLVAEWGSYISRVPAVAPLRLVVPPFIDADKKDAHTEHCCAEHKRCKYQNKKCTVTSGRKKPSYPCNCEHM